MNNWGGKRKNCGRKRNEQSMRKDHRSEELKAAMKKNTEINDKHFANQKGRKNEILSENRKFV